MQKFIDLLKLVLLLIGIFTLTALCFFLLNQVAVPKILYSLGPIPEAMQGTVTIHSILISILDNIVLQVGVALTLGIYAYRFIEFILWRFWRVDIS